MYLEDKTLIKSLKKSTWESFIPSILLIIFAIILLQNEENFISTAVSIFGYFAVVIGVVLILLFFHSKEEERRFSKNLQTGILLLAFGITSFFENSLFSDIIMVLLGGYIIFQNASRLSLSINIRKYTIWIYVFVLSLVSLILGMVIIISPFTTDINTYLASLIIISQVFLMIENVLLLLGVKNEDDK